MEHILREEYQGAYDILKQAQIETGEIYMAGEE